MARAGLLIDRVGQGQGHLTDRGEPWPDDLELVTYFCVIYRLSYGYTL